MVYVFLAVLIVVVGLVAYLCLAPGPRRARACRRAQRLLDAGNWSEALSIVRALQANPSLTPAWQDRLRTIAGESLQYAGDAELKEQRYEESLQHYLAAAPLLRVAESDQRARVINAMLAEVRRLFAAGTGSADTEKVLQLLTRLFQLQSDCAEASFWLALCNLRRNQTEAAQGALTRAHEQAGKLAIDPALYLGVLTHRLGQPQEALRFLAEANRIDATCPFVTWQMGLSLVAAGGDASLAVRALQRALGPRGFALWTQNPERAWVEAFPEGRSYVRRLAEKHRFLCPLLGGDLNVLVLQGQLALAQAHYRQGNFAQSADLYGKLLQECPPTVPLLRGFGLALARLEQYDLAYKHLRTALEQEQPKDAFTAGYLALCGACGKPTQQEDKPKNVAWAIRLLARFVVYDNAEWAGLMSRVHAEARSLGMTVSVEDQVQLCDVLASVDATDARAAAAYAQLAQTSLESIQPRYAWLYVRAASIGNVAGEGDLNLFARAFRNAEPARAFFAERGWEPEQAEYTYLEHSAQRAPGRFPEALGPDYPARGEAFLLERSRQEEAAGRKDSARQSVEVLLQLMPHSLAGHDRLACLHYRAGNQDRALALLTGWQRLAPTDPWPLVRQAIIEQERGNAARRAEAIDRALGLTQGQNRAAVAFLGARLALRDHAQTEQHDSEAAVERNGDGQAPESSLQPALTLLEECLRADPDHVEALWCLAAARSVAGDQEGLAALAPAMDRPLVQDGRFHFLGAVCNLAARNYPQVLALGERAAADRSLTIESQYVMALAHLHQKDAASARQALLTVAAAESSPSAPYARALLGHLSFVGEGYDEAIRWWQQVDPKLRSGWKLDETLRQTVLLAGLKAFSEGRYEKAGDRFREAGKLGLRDRRLGSLLTLSLVKAGQRLLYEGIK